MRLFGSVLVGLAATTSTETTWTGRLNTTPPSLVTWLVDGNNLACSRSVPNDRETIIEELGKMASPDDANPSRISNVVLVFDGHEGEQLDKKIKSQWFQYVITDGMGREKDRADNYIVEHAVPSLKPLGGRVHLVSADKELGKRVQSSGIMKGGSLIHPPKFWKEYLPNLQQRS